MCCWKLAFLLPKTHLVSLFSLRVLQEAKKLSVLWEISFSAPKISNNNENELEDEANFIGNVDTFDTSKMIVMMNALFT